MVGSEHQSKEVLVEAMPSVKKAWTEALPWALCEVDRLNDNLEESDGKRKPP